MHRHTNILLLLFLRLPEISSPKETEPSSKVKVCVCYVSWFVLSVASSQIAVSSRDPFYDIIVTRFARSGNFQTNRWRLERITPNSTVQTLREKWVEKKWICLLSPSGRLLVKNHSPMLLFKVISTLILRPFFCSAWTLSKCPPSVFYVNLYFFIPAGQKDDHCSEKSGKGRQDWHEAHVLFL